jgi:hypothetical protein
VIKVVNYKIKNISEERWTQQQCTYRTCKSSSPSPYKPTCHCTTFNILLYHPHC